MGKEKKTAKRSASLHRSREKQKKHHKKREFSSSQEKGVNRENKHNSYRHKDQKYSNNERLQNKDVANDKQKIIKELPSWQPSGILLQFYNSRDGVNLKFHEPPESRQPTDQWKIYVFKGEQVMQPIQLVNSCYLIGKDERICDVLCLNPSISRQHSVLQFRLISKMNIEGDYSESIRPYIMDLESTNGTFLNDEKLEASRYVELLHKDVLRFGFSDRLYVLVKNEDTIRAENLEQQ